MSSTHTDTSPSPREETALKKYITPNCQPGTDRCETKLASASTDDTVCDYDRYVPLRPDTHAFESLEDGTGNSGLRQSGSSASCFAPSRGMQHTMAHDSRLPELLLKGSFLIRKHDHIWMIDAADFD